MLMFYYPRYLIECSSLFSQNMFNSDWQQISSHDFKKLVTLNLRKSRMTNKNGHCLLAQR